MLIVKILKKNGGDILVNNMNIKKGKIIRWYRLRCPYCGNEIYKPYFYLVIKHLFRNKSYYACPKCHKSTCYVSAFRTVNDHTDKQERELNKNIWEKRLLK